MLYKREFKTEASCEAAQTRAHGLLTAYGFRLSRQGKVAEYERSVAGAGLVVVHPRSVYAKLTLWTAELPEGGCSVSVMMTIQKFGQPSCVLDRALWTSELDDLQALLIRNEHPTLDRQRQNQDAGVFGMILLGLAVVAAIIAGLLAGGAAESRIWAAAAALTVLAVLMAVYTYAPFKPRPHPMTKPLPGLSPESSS